jgi:uncharacterized protein YunC (DUF1805 family)
MLGSITTTLSSAAAKQELGKQLKKTFSIQNAGYSMILKLTQATTKLAYEQDSALVSFNKQTGAARLYGDELVALESSMFRHGVTSADAAEALGGLARTVHGLKTMSRSARTDLVETTGILQELGVSAETTGANVHFMTRSLGMSVKESGKYQRELFTLAQQIGMPPAEMAEGFKSAAPKLAAFGKDAGRVFKKLAVAARASGMEIQQMLGIVEQFDTFEGAATSVGKLNALLGGPFLNSMEMVMQTDPTERMRMLSGALNKAGKSFDQLTYYEKKSIAAAAGLSDVNELALVMAGNFSGAAGGAQQSQAEIQKLAAQTKEFNEIGEELLQVVRMFAIEMKPVIGRLKEWIESFQKNKDEIQKILPALAALAGAFLFISTAMAIASAAAVVGWAAILGPLIIIPAFLLVGWKYYEWLGSLEIAFVLASVAAAGLAVAFSVITGPVALVAVGVAALLALMWYCRDGVMALTSALGDMMNTIFFTNVGESNFIQGIRKFGKANHKLGEEMRGVKSASDELNKSLDKTSDISISTLRSEKALAKAQVSSSSALPEATAAAKPPVYSSTEGGLASKSGGTSKASSTQSDSPRKIEVVVKTDPLFARYFSTDVTEIIGGRRGPLNAVTEGTG